MLKSEKNEDFTKLVRLPLLVLGTVVYNVIALSLLWYYEFSFEAITGLVISILLSLLLLRYSALISFWVRQPTVTREEFNRLLTFPLILWTGLTITVLIPWVWLWISAS